MAVLTALACVVLLNVYAGVLIVLRSTVYRVPLYRPMLVNIGLSFLPVVLAAGAIAGLLLITPYLTHLPATPASVLVWVYVGIGTLVWLLFFPNSVYLITELNFSHRVEDSPVPLWYDIVQTLALTISGIANAIASLAAVQTSLIVLVVDPSDRGVPAGSWVFAGVVLVLGAVGVYLGRYLRFNSWDVRHPPSMVRKLATHFRQRGKALEAGAFVASHAVLVALVYVPVYVLAYAESGA
ncbi:DUF1361 domain-containing protein [Microbacterium sp. No. 7]|uniref:DUF1361 domain-containing protein n=1 Tax=Microbacterium sp. No. 7 TaxID=1714373 RepID=UPI0006D239AA|nr:DUF1361 domain-containing protein [Microbacterium sp. No. 7]ALJ22296.1 hypothetical protein AOA12_21375 [Microbacterium sp. No. 7]